MHSAPPRDLKAIGFEQVTGVAASAKALSSIPANTRGCLIQVDTTPVRFRDDGTAPTATVGIRLANDAVPVWYVGRPEDLQFIATTGTAVINVSYYG